MPGELDLEKLPSILDDLDLAVWAILPGPVWQVRWSAGVYDQYALPRGSVPPTNEDFFRFMHPDDANVTAAEFSRVLKEGGPHSWRARIVRADGKVRHLVTRARRLPPDEQGQRWVVGVDHDVTDLVETARLLESERAFRFVAENIHDVVFRVSGDRTIEFASPSVRQLLGYEPEELVGRDCTRLIHKDDLARVQEEFRGQLAARDGNQLRRIEHRLVRKDGSSIWVEASPKLVYDLNDRLIGWVDVVRDIEARRASDARISHMARHDPLTDLPNRAEFSRRLSEALAPATSAVAVLCLDLDRFKTVNDTFGHGAGDRLLQEAARRLLDAQMGFGAVAGRLGGDEFVMLLTDASPTRATALAEHVVMTLGRDYELFEQRVAVGASVGIAISPAHGLEPEALLRAADLALYRAKAEGRNTVRLFEPRMDEHRRERRRLELDLRQALTSGSLELHFQPIISTATSAIVTVEALVRWRTAEGTFVPPGQFVALAEEVGLIGRLGEWVLREACHVAAGWPPDVRLAVNVSPGQFRDPGLVSTVLSALRHAGLEPSRLELEITENLLLEPNEDVLAMLHRLKGLGVTIALDDFGTGYSSLSFLRVFPFDVIKIDRSFVAELESPEASAIVQAVIALGRRLRIATTAEGVETEEQLRVLETAGCTAMQGYLLQTPVSAREVSAMLRSRERRRVAA